MDILKKNHQQWCGNRNIMISDKFSIKEIYENYFSKLNFHENEKTNFEVVVQNEAEPPHDLQLLLLLDSLLLGC